MSAINIIPTPDGKYLLDMSGVGGWCALLSEHDNPEDAVEALNEFLDGIATTREVFVAEPSRPLVAGDKVSKVGGDYRFDGIVVGVFFKQSGKVRYAVEDDRGVIHIYSAKNLIRRP